MGSCNELRYPYPFISLAYYLKTSHIFFSLSNITWRTSRLNKRTKPHQTLSPSQVSRVYPLAYIFYELVMSTSVSKEGSNCRIWAILRDSPNRQHHEFLLHLELGIWDLTWRFIVSLELGFMWPAAIFGLLHLLSLDSCDLHQRNPNQVCPQVNWLLKSSLVLGMTWLWAEGIPAFPSWWPLLHFSSSILALLQRCEYQSALSRLILHSTSALYLKSFSHGFINVYLRPYLLLYQRLLLACRASFPKPGNEVFTRRFHHNYEGF